MKITVVNEDGEHEQEIPDDSPLAKALQSLEEEFSVEVRDARRGRPERKEEEGETS